MRALFFYTRRPANGAVSPIQAFRLKAEAT